MYVNKINDGYSSYSVMFFANCKIKICSTNFSYRLLYEDHEVWSIACVTLQPWILQFAYCLRFSKDHLILWELTETWCSLSDSLSNSLQILIKTLKWVWAKSPDVDSRCLIECNTESGASNWACSDVYWTVWSGSPNEFIPNDFEWINKLTRLWNNLLQAQFPRK